MSRIILPLDGMTKERAMELAAAVRGLVWGFKVNDLLLEEGVKIIRELKPYGNVMADPKLFDIPNTMENSLHKLIKAGADIVTIHCSALYKPPEGTEKIVAGVTVLTSFDYKKCAMVHRRDVGKAVSDFATFASDSSYEYIVCAGTDLKVLNKNIIIKKICPGIRPLWYQEQVDDQERTMTPADAVKAGADLLVIGRPILRASNPVEAIHRTSEEIYFGLSGHVYRA